MKSAIPQPESLMDDEAIRLRMMEPDPSEHDHALNQLYTHTRRPLAQMLLDRFWALPPEDHGDIISKTFFEIHRKLKRNELDLERPLAPLLFQIAACRAKDALRAKSTKKRSHVDFYADVAEVLEAEGYASEWRHYVATGKAQVIQDKFSQLLPTLQNLPKLVGQAMAAGFPHFLTDPELCDEVEALSGRRYSVFSVKEARLEVRMKFRLFLSGN